MASPLLNIFFLVLFLVGAGLLTAFNTALMQYGKVQSKELFKKKKIFYFYYLFKRFFKKNEWENLYFILSFTKHILYLLYAISFAILLISSAKLSTQNWLHITFLMIVVVGLSLLFDFIMRLFAIVWKKGFYLFSAPIVSIFLLILFPITGLLLKISRFIFSKTHLQEKLGKYFVVKEVIMDLIQDAELGNLLNKIDQKILTSFLTFHEKVAREIMIPRIDIVSVSEETTIREAAKLFLSEDYSRIPVYKENLDHIVGVLMYKDVLKLFTKSEEEKGDILERAVSSIIKSVIYAPENKKISHLFQEFKNKQKHMAIIVNEYGGTEGIVTIEDILEEIVGEIEDEYDIDEERQYWQLPNGCWVVDAKMSIIDVEAKLNISIPHNPEYETIGGFVFHRAGSIPSKGWRIHLDDFELEVLISNERCIEKVRITPLKEKDSTL